MSTVSRTAGAAALLVAALAGAPAAAQADAPYRFTAIDLTGNQANEVAARAASAGGREVLFDAWGDRSSYSPQALLRDVSAAKTFAIAPKNAWTLNASDDLSKIVVSTSASLDPADTNSYNDDYLVDRATGTTTLLSRDWPSGEAWGGKYNSSALVSGDGKVAYVSAWDWTGDSELYRVDLATKTRTLLGKGIFGSSDVDTAGKVVILSDGALVGDRRVPLPEGQTIVAADGSVTVAKNKSELTIVDLATGEQRTAVLADFLKTNPYDLLGISSGGTTAYVGAVTGTGSAKKYAVATLNTATGALTIIRNDIVWVAQSGRPVLSPDLSYLAFGTHVSPLFGSSVPGPSVAIPEIPTNEFLLAYPGCAYGGPFYQELIRPSVFLRGVAIGINGRKPTKADVTVTVDKTGAVANKFTITAGQRRSLNAGWGGFTITSKVYYSDGQSSTGTRKVAPYRPIKNDYNPLNGGASFCYQANDLY